VIAYAENPQCRPGQPYVGQRLGAARRGDAHPSSALPLGSLALLWFRRRGLPVSKIRGGDSVSVRRYTLEEVGRLYADILALRPRVLFWGRDEAIREALAAAIVANRAAHAMTYGRGTVIEQLQVPDAGLRPVEPGEVFKELSLLLYNCVSNGGRDFLPQEDRAVLEEIRLGIAWSLAEEAVARPPPRPPAKATRALDRGGPDPMNAAA